MIRRGVGFLAAVSLMVGFPVVAHADSAGHGAESSGSVQSAVSLAAASGSNVLVSGLESSTQEVWAHPDGSLEAHESPMPVRGLTASGWQGLDGSLSTGVDGRVHPRVASVTTSFAGTQQTTLATLSTGSGSVSLGWGSVLPAPVVSGGWVTYPDVWPGVDVVAESTASGFESFVVVKSRAAAMLPQVQRLTMALQLGSGLQASVSDRGGVSVSNQSGVGVFDVAPVRMYDSSDVPAGSGASSAQVVAASGDGRTGQVSVGLSAGQIVVSPSTSFLQDPATVYPVVIDPEVSTHVTGAGWAMVWSDGESFYNQASQQPRVGYDGWTGMKVSRSFFTMDTSAFAGTHVVKALFSENQTHSPQDACNSTTSTGTDVSWAGKISSATTWSNQPSSTPISGAATSFLAHGASTGCPGYSLEQWDVTSLITSMAASNVSSVTLGLRSTNESDMWGWRKYELMATHNTPYLDVVFNHFPSVPAAPSISSTTTVNGVSYVADSTPTMSVAVNANDAGQSVEAVFDISSPSREVNFTSAAVVSSGVATVTVPDGSWLADGTYTVKARAFDTVDWSSWGPTTTVIVDTQPPPSPVVTSTLPAAQRVVPGEGFTLTVAPGPGSRPVSRYVYSLTGDTSAMTGSVSASSATIPITAATAGLQTIVVAAVSWSGKVGPATTYRYMVTSPVLSLQDQWLLDRSGVNQVTGKPAMSVPAASSAGSWVPSQTCTGGVCTGQSAAFNVTSGSAVVTAPVTDMDSTNDFTVAAWVNPSTAGTGTQVVCAATGPSGQVWALELVAGQWKFTTTGTTTAITTGITAMPGHWQLVVGTYSRLTNQIQLFVQPSGASVSATDPVAAGSRPGMTSGVSAGNVSGGFSGAIADVQLYYGDATAQTVQNTISVA